MFVTKSSVRGDFGADSDPFDVADSYCLQDVDSFRPDLKRQYQFKAWLSTSQVIFFFHFCIFLFFNLLYCVFQKIQMVFQKI